MDRRELGDTGRAVTEIGLGTWTMGGSWGDVDREDCENAIRAALDSGTNFIDTADVYGGGRAEEIVADVLAEEDPDEEIHVATKAGRGLSPHEADQYTHENLEAAVDESRERLGVESLDLLQLHCPPTETYYQPETFEALAALEGAGKIDSYGVSVEKCEEALKAIEYPGVETVQLIFNAFRQRPAELFFEEAKRRDVGVIVRVPLASGLLADAFDADTEIAEGDHRKAAAEGGVADGVGGKGGETFAGVPFEEGLRAVEELRPLVPEDATMAQYALRWLLDFDAVTTVIPGSTSPEHVRDNAAAADLDPLSHREHGAVRDIYEEYVAEHVHHRW
ncbi:aldo/keto reductase [Halococcus agarilyticus]|uniref:aldo/keto reductase n=1 Tax=Halococcus agarilyticus TaxID=1232219 RepID=UPI00067828DD|nr:aldo/keto reductase [Halococcus agarilyticus]